MFLRKIAITLAALMFVALTGCGSDSQNPLVPYVERGSSNDGAPQLFTLDVPSQKSTAVAISIPTNALYVSSNPAATAVTYCYGDNTGYDIFMMGTDNQEKPLTTGADACESVFSPDGKTIAFVNNPGSNYEIFTMNADGSNQTALYAPAAGSMQSFLPAFSPDGKSVVFYIEIGGLDAIQRQKTGRHLAGEGSSWMQARTRSTKTVVRGSVHPEDTVPTQNGWYVMALTDTAPTLVYATDNWWGTASFSGDSTKLLMTIYDGTEWNVAAVNLDGTGFTQLTTDTATQDYAPIPYKNLILFNRDNESASSVDIYIMDQTGANQTLVSSTANEDESLSDSYEDE